jgi:hypothetical protein
VTPLYEKPNLGFTKEETEMFSEPLKALVYSMYDARETSIITPSLYNQCVQEFRMTKGFAGKGEKMQSIEKSDDYSLQVQPTIDAIYKQL